MSVKFTVREISNKSITVDYDDGTWAIVPIHSGMDRNAIEIMIADHNHSSNSFETLDQVPFVLGEVVEAQSSKEIGDNQIVTYKEMRSANYPSIGDQLDALYWARNGDTSQLESIDLKIEETKNLYPKTLEPITSKEANDIINSSVNNVLG